MQRYGRILAVFCPLFFNVYTIALLCLLLRAVFLVLLTKATHKTSLPNTVTGITAAAPAPATNHKSGEKREGNHCKRRSNSRII